MIPVALVAVLGASAVAAVTVESGPEQGVETVIVVSDDAGAPARGETVRVLHRPGLGGEREVAIGITDGRGRVRWTPEVGGLAVVRAGEASAPLGVAPAEAPLQVGTLVALVALGAVAAVVWGLVPPGVRVQG